MAKTKSNQLLKILVVAAIIILIPILTPNMYIMQIIKYYQQKYMYIESLWQSLK